MSWKMSSNRQGKRGREDFDAGHPVAEMLRSVTPDEVRMDEGARQRLMGHLYSVQRRNARARVPRVSPTAKYVLAGAAALAVGLVLVLTLVLPVGQSPPQGSSCSAAVEVMAGQVDVMPKGGEWCKVEGGSYAEEGSRIRTGPASIARLKFADGSKARLTDCAEVRIEELLDDSVSLEHVAGNTYHRVEPGTRYMVSAEDVTLRALGTAFNVDNSSPGNLEIVTVQSAVEVKIGRHKPIKVNQGEVMVVTMTQDKKAEKRPVSRERLQEPRLLSSVQEDAQEGYQTGIYEKIDVVGEESEEEEEDATAVTARIDLRGTVAESGVSLEWKAPEGIDYREFTLLRSEGGKPIYPDDEIASYSDISIRFATDDGVKSGHTYQYRVAAVTSDGDLVYSDTVVVDVPAPEPEPTEVSVTLVSSLSANGVTVEWSVNGASRFSGFVLERSVQGAPQDSDTTTDGTTVVRIESQDVFNTYLDTEVQGGNTYSYRVGLIVDGAVMVYSNSALAEVPEP